METHFNSKVYDTDIYVRLSREDGDKSESDSIVNQKELIKNFIRNKPEFRLHQIRVDDGYSGVNFNRPAFIDMLSDIRAGKVNCVIVKDLSRFGRNYIEAGKYITNIFPFLNVRFIAINDNFDTADITKNNSQIIYVHFKNLMNDAYCNDISLKTRSSLDIKCKNGCFLSAYAPYGYLKSPSDKNKLIVDEDVKENILNIFNWKLSGMSALRIAEKLNSIGISSPMEHKKEIGIKLNAAKRNISPLWSAKAVTRILQNKIYIGTLEQHKTTTPNYKVKQRILKPEREWIVIENNHEPIVSHELFYSVQKLLKEDTRVSPDKESLNLFSGILKCGKCGSNMTRKKVISGKKEFYYYICSEHKNRKDCDNSVSISAKKFEKTILEMLNMAFSNFIKAQETVDSVLSAPFHNTAIDRLNEKIAECIEKKKQFQKHSLSLYEDLKSNIINEKDYKALKKMYSDEVTSLDEKIENINKEISVLSKDNRLKYIEYAENRKFESLSRKIAVTFIDKIFVYDKERIEISFNFQADYDVLLKYIDKAALPATCLDVRKGMD